MSMTYSELVGYGMARGMSRTDATRFALDVTGRGKTVKDNKEAEVLLTAFAVAGGIALTAVVGAVLAADVVDDALLGVPGAVIGGVGEIAVEGLGFLADLFF